MLVAGYYLARCGYRKIDGRPALPPLALGVSTWKTAYDLFYDAMGDGRTPSQFRHSMNNTRADFDPLFDNGRTGWLGWNPDRELPAQCAQIHEAWKDRSDQELEAFVLDTPQIVPLPEVREARTEGGEKIITSIRRERDLKLRNDAMHFHGFDCMVCGFNFKKFYGEIGKQFIEVHHVVPLSEAGERETNPETDLVVLCSNCHRMVHRRKGICLSVDELKKHIRR